MFAKITNEKLKNRKTLNNNLVKKLKADCKMCLNGFDAIENKIFPKKTTTILYQLENHLKIYCVDDKPVLAQLGTGQVIPNLIIAMENKGLMPAVYVDEGAVRALLKGADLMAPGIKEMGGEFEEGQVVEIRLLKQEIPFAIGVAKVSSDEIDPKTKGVAITIAHILKDELWNRRNNIMG